jgi:hypothetical protein
MTSPATMRLVLAVLVVALWLGAALLLAGAVAPAAFAALPNRALAGAVVGRVLPVVFFAGIAAGALVTVLELAGGAAPFARARVIAGLALGGACGIPQFVIAPRIHRLREAIGPSVEALAADDARRLAFGRLHGMSVAWMGVGMLAAVTAIVLCLLALRARS